MYFQNVDSTLIFMTNYKLHNPESENKPEKSSGFTIDNISVGHNNNETYLKMGDYVVILPPQSAKRMALELKNHIQHYEKEHGKIAEPVKKSESLPKKIIKALYKSHKVAPKLTSVNTQKRKRR